MASDLINKLFLELAGFIFYLYELYKFFHYSESFSTNGSVEIYFLRLVMLFLALPLLYLFRVAYFFDCGDALCLFLSGLFKFENENTFFQVKLFYNAIYILLSILLFFDALEYIYNFL